MKSLAFIILNMGGKLWNSSWYLIRIGAQDIFSLTIQSSFELLNHTQLNKLKSKLMHVNRTTNTSRESWKMLPKKSRIFAQSIWKGCIKMSFISLENLVLLLYIFTQYSLHYVQLIWPSRCSLVVGFIKIVKNDLMIFPCAHMQSPIHYFAQHYS
jgi:hypothetical protein